MKTLKEFLNESSGDFKHNKKIFDFVTSLSNMKRKGDVSSMRADKSNVDLNTFRFEKQGDAKHKSVIEKFLTSTGYSRDNSNKRDGVEIWRTKLSSGGAPVVEMSYDGETVYAIVYTNRK